MLQRCFSIYDSRTVYYQPPFFSPTTFSGVRMFEHLVRDPTSLASKFPEDFSLYQVGSFDDTTGQLIPSVPEVVCTAAQLVHRTTD